MFFQYEMQRVCFFSVESTWKFGWRGWWPKDEEKPKVASQHVYSSLLLVHSSYYVVLFLHFSAMGDRKCLFIYCFWNINTISGTMQLSCYLIHVFNSPELDSRFFLLFLYNIDAWYENKTNELLTETWKTIFVKQQWSNAWSVLGLLSLHAHFLFSPYCS